MSVKLRRYQANDSDFTQNGRIRTTVTVPGSAGFTDLTESNLILDMQVNVKGAAGANVFYPATFGARGEMVGPQALIRNARVISREHGLLNEQRHQNVISSNLDWYTKTRGTEDAHSLLGNTTNQNYGHDNASLLPDNPFLLYNQPGTPGVAITANPTKRRAMIPVAWKHIDQFSSMAQFPNIAIGDIDYDIELEEQINTMFPVVMPCMAELLEDVTADNFLIGTAADPLVTKRTVSSFNRRPRVGDEIYVMFKETTSNEFAESSCVISAVTEVGGVYHIQVHGGITTTDTNEACEQVIMYLGSYQERPSGDPDESKFLPIQSQDITPTGATIGSAADPLIFTNVYGGLGGGQEVDFHACPFYIGAPMHITAFNDTTKVLYQAYVTVSSLEIDAANPTDLKVQFDPPLNIGAAGNDIQYIKIAFVDHYDNAGTPTAFSVTWQIDEIYLELHELQLNPQQLTQARTALSNMSMSWFEHRLVQKNMPATTVHSDVLELESNCVGMAVLTPQNLNLLSGFDTCTSYRFALDGKDVTDRDIICGTATTTGRSIHNNMLKKYFANKGQQLVKYDANPQDYASPDPQRTFSFFPLVTPQLQRPQTMQIQLFADTNMSSKNIFYVATYARMLEISNGRVSVL